MNLERLFIENYKQLRDPVELLLPEGAIGVVGPNGAGKSTLFETILWAFFGGRGNSYDQQRSLHRPSAAQEQRHDRRGAGR